jgi:hypothetical protein
VVLNFADRRIVDHTFMEQLHFRNEYQHGGYGIGYGFEYFQLLPITRSLHEILARKNNKLEIKLSPRQIELRKFAKITT